MAAGRFLAVRRRGNRDMQRPTSKALSSILLTLVLGLFASVGANATRTSPLPLCSTSCTVWSPCEIRLGVTDSSTEADLYANLLKATVTQTSGGTDSRVVPGFYFDRVSYGSGLATFTIRFTPVSAGTYQYTTTSSPI